MDWYIIKDKVISDFLQSYSNQSVPHVTENPFEKLTVTEAVLKFAFVYYCTTFFIFIQLIFLVLILSLREMGLEFVRDVNNSYETNSVDKVNRRLTNMFRNSN